MTSQAERISMLEVRVKNVEDKIDNMDKKLDDLLALRNKGAGVFWLASALVGTGIVSVFLQIVSWFGGK